MMPPVGSTIKHFERCRRDSLAVGLVLLLVFIVGGYFDPGQFLRAYLPAYLFYFGIAMGSMVLLMIYHITGGAWGFLIRRTLEASMRTLPLLTLGFVPIAAGVEYLYPWAMPAEIEASGLVRAQQLYLNWPFFLLRAVVFFALWLTLAFFLSSWSRAQDSGRNPTLARRLDGLSGLGLVIYGVTIHFASVDWIMSLQPAFHSTIFGPVVASGQVLSAAAFALVILAWLHRLPPVDEVVSSEALRDLGNLLLTFVIVWAYMCWFQYMLIWIANLPVDVVWYVPRMRDGWQWVAMALVLVHFAVPFLLLLSRRVKQQTSALAWIAGVLLFMQIVFSDYQVLPAFRAARLRDHWMDIVAPIGLGGIWLAAVLHRLDQQPLLVENDDNRIAATGLRQAEEHEASWEEALSHG